MRDFLIYLRNIVAIGIYLFISYHAIYVMAYMYMECVDVHDFVEATLIDFVVFSLVAIGGIILIQIIKNRDDY